jgi:hypothetical protein
MLELERARAAVEAARLDNIEQLESRMLALPQIEMPVIERFINGMYTREIVIPRGALLTGRVWKNDYVDIMLEGDILIAIPSGTSRLTGANVCDGKAGRKRAGYAFRDTHWITVQRADQVVGQNIIEHLTFFGVAEYEAWLDVQDYQRVLVELGVSQAVAQEQTRDETDLAFVPIGNHGLRLAASPLDGVGLFTDWPFTPGAVVGPARIGDRRTQLGRYTNHARRPNCRMVWAPGGVNLVASKHIVAGAELTVDYRHPHLREGAVT